ncbi:hypothetical protein PV327_010084 [Microctonus hyperodae]|uniref:Pre-mRNA-splicing factor 38 n=1 Tax=Microctonus hyperodae TaxID=165561 RepID=A0AA39F2C1_MICHY|nr:hypothetical protein PV327_010084 [Microctonus hyperodae]
MASKNWSCRKDRKVTPYRKKSHIINITILHVRSITHMSPRARLIGEDSVRKRYNCGFLKNEELKYVRVLGALYIRLTGICLDCYKYLEPLFNDKRKSRIQSRQGQYEIIHIDEFIDILLKE